MQINYSKHYRYLFAILSLFKLNKTNFIFRFWFRLIKKSYKKRFPAAFKMLQNRFLKFTNRLKDKKLNYLHNGI